MKDIQKIVNEVLAGLAEAKHVPASAEPSAIITDSLDQMRLLVALEECLQIAFDDATLEPFDLSSRAALASSVELMLCRKDSV